MRAETEHNLLKAVADAGSSENSELSIENGSTSFNVFKNFDSTKYWASNSKSTTASMSTLSIEIGTTRKSVFLGDEVSNTKPISIRRTEHPAIVERARPFGTETQNLPDHVVRTFLNKTDTIAVKFTVDCFLINLCCICLSLLIQSLFHLNFFTYKPSSNRYCVNSSYI